MMHGNTKLKFVFPYRFNPSPNCFYIGGEWTACVFTLYMKKIALAAEYCRIIRVKRIGLFYRVCNDPSFTVLDGRNIFFISFTPFYVCLNVKETVRHPVWKAKTAICKKSGSDFKYLSHVWLGTIWTRRYKITLQLHPLWRSRNDNLWAALL